MQRPAKDGRVIYNFFSKLRMSNLIIHKEKRQFGRPIIIQALYSTVP
jgi:hypothetical protein